MQSYLIISQNDHFIDQHITSLKGNRILSPYNVHLFSASPSITITMVRAIQAICSRKPLAGGKLLIIIKDIDSATAEAANALLKILEEPPSYAYIVLSASNQHKVLPTISSRCHMIKESVLTKRAARNEKMITQIKTIFISSEGERLLISGKIAKSKDETVDFLDNLLNALEISLSSSINDLSIPSIEIASLVHKVIYAKNYIESNVNYKLVLDVLLLGFPHIKS